MFHFQRTYRFLANRAKNEALLRKIDISKWYFLQNPNFLSKELLEKFHQCHYDQETQTFIEVCHKTADSFFYHFFLFIMKQLLRPFLSTTSICGLLSCGEMFVFSSIQVEQFVIGNMEMHRKTIDTATNSFDDRSRDCQNLAMLDIGAGSGSITSKLSKYFLATYVTELSITMRYRLRSRGYSILDAERWNQTVNSGGHNCIRFNLISCLNVLDRCDRPLTMLYRIRDSLKSSDGYLLLAIVIPIKQYVENKSTHLPEENLSIQGDCFECQVESFYQNILIPSGFDVIRWTKLPYLSAGSFECSYYYLLDSVFLLKPLVI
ncbi:Methyltransferase-like protein 9 [Sarcoptes scabiei]|uniref:Methyltransferase-like protein 9 n=1 Tax=Sarcoptes scabiei TaxID=52283 RepID=A0A834RFE5_SARSC|nr:Methyltransferase-like protein 9 [Sarcoptes scabiei]UXI21915.1 uncharacterized protein NH340_JMT07858 [Sarcoptes scabiei]